MRHELMYAKQTRNSATIPRATFLDVLDHECDPGQKLDHGRLGEIADAFADRNGAIDCGAFL